MLREKGINSYLPLVKTLRQWSDRKKFVEFPLISGYIFVKLKSENEKEIVYGTKGVVNFVRLNGKVGIVYENEVNAMKQLIDLGYHLESFSGVKKIGKGDKILISSGPLKNLEGIVIEENDQKIFEIYLEGIGYNVRVKLPDSILKKIS